MRSGWRAIATLGALGAVGGAVGAAACGPAAVRGAAASSGAGAAAPAPGASAGASSSRGDRDVTIVLYRDGALVRDRRWVDVPAGGVEVQVALPDDVVAGDVLVTAGAGAHVPEVVRGGREIAPGTDARAQLGALDVHGAVRAASGVWVLDDGATLHLIDPPAISFATARVGARVGARVEAAQPGRYPVDVLYVTRALSWRATYTLIGGGPGGLLHGSLIVDDRGLALGPSRVTLVDGALGDAAGEVAQALAQTGNDTLVATPLPELVDVRDGELAVDLVGGERAITTRSVLVYDPIGTSLDAGGRMPIQAESYGVGKTSSAVDESIEIELGAGALPAGTVRLVERDGDGVLRLRGQGALRSAAGAVTTVSVGRSPDVTGKRHRIDYALDLHAKRLVEEFEVTLDDRGDRDVDVLVREHLYRGIMWSAPFISVEDYHKEAAQQFVMRTHVPAHGHARVVYVVVYTW